MVVTQELNISHKSIRKITNFLFNIIHSGNGMKN